MKINAISRGYSQRGAALIVALLILVVVSVLGVSAMKTSMFAAKVATGTQADAMVFEAAESSVADMYNTINNMNEVALTEFLVDQVVARRCFISVRRGIKPGAIELRGPSRHCSYCGSTISMPRHWVGCSSPGRWPCS